MHKETPNIFGQADCNSWPFAPPHNGQLFVFVFKSILPFAFSTSLLIKCNTRFQLTQQLSYLYWTHIPRGLCWLRLPPAHVWCVRRQTNQTEANFSNNFINIAFCCNLTFPVLSVHIQANRDIQTVHRAVLLEHLSNSNRVYLSMLLPTNVCKVMEIDCTKIWAQERLDHMLKANATVSSICLASVCPSVCDTFG